MPSEKGQFSWDFNDSPAIRVDLEIEPQVYGQIQALAISMSSDRRRYDTLDQREYNSLAGFLHYRTTEGEKVSKFHPH